eukprot:TRINITY_DN596_c2_g1_i1.p1 TRINITY_DN596_c2_g1~~TRINITY_DN596_c2_g1_i1.p1  ORF type:complete len:422 (-),score=153.49 TRINITY_DN596_c2_g1_i1:50-1315(-)
MACLPSPTASRIRKDLNEINSRNNPDSPLLFAQTKDDNLAEVVALVVGPPETPYASGFFLFSINYKETYPNQPPHVLIVTTDDGNTRFNPNLYSSGKVCLSILGTWSGESADEWRCSYTTEYILQAIQALIMNSTPYYNEPGFEKDSSRYSSTVNEIGEYSQKIQHETLRIAVCQNLKKIISGEEIPFSQLIKHLFRFYYYQYLAVANANLNLDGRDFFITRFESICNCAKGKFNYATIIRDINNIKAALDEETESWKNEGLVITRNQSGRKYLKLLEEADKFESGKYDVANVSCGPASKDNLFHWNISIVGPEGSMWESGFFNVEIIFSNDDSPARVRFITQMFHPQITPCGIPYILVPTGVRELVKPIASLLVNLLKSPINSNQVTWLNIEAATLAFGNDEQKRQFRSQVSNVVRRSQD